MSAPIIYYFPAFPRHTPATPPPPPFTPADITSLVYELYPDGYSYVERTSPSTLCTDGAVIGTVNSRAGTASAVATAFSDATRPTFKTNILNGKPIFRFNPAGGAKRLRTAFTLNQPYTRFLVFNHSGPQNGSTILADGATADTGYIYFSTTNTLRLYAGSSGPVQTCNNGTWYAACAIFNGASSSLRITPDSATTANAGSSNAGGASIGAGNGSASPNFGCTADIAYDAIFAGIMSSDDIARMYSYIADTWGQLW